MAATTRFFCPFCGATVYETDTPFHSAGEIEIAARTHLLERHPIRWRLSRKFRRAMAQSMRRVPVSVR